MMRLARNTVRVVATILVPDPLPPAIIRPRQHVESVLTHSLHESGDEGRAALAWAWALSGTRPSPITLSIAPGRPPSGEDITAEGDADPEGSTAPPGVPSDYCDQLGEARGILAWLVGASDEIPLDDEHRGRFIGARDDYARTDQQIRQVRDCAARSLMAIDLPEPMYRADAANPWRWDPNWMNAAWHRGIRDLLEWVLGDRPASPLTGHIVHLPAAYDLSHEETAVRDVVAQRQPGGRPVEPSAYPPPQYGETIQAAIFWLRGEIISPPTNLERTGAHSHVSKRSGHDPMQVYGPKHNG